MKDVETLLSLIAGLLYLIVSAIRKHKANPAPKPDWEEAVWPEPAVSGQQPASTDQQKEVPASSPLLVKDTLPLTRPYRIPGSFMLKDTRLPSRPNPTKLHQPLPPSPDNRLERVLGRYGSLKKAIIMSEMLQPKTFC